MAEWNDFYLLDNVVATADGYECRIRLNGDHAIFAAHFPGEPITPGACIVRIAEEVLGRCLQRDITVTRIATAKFLAVIRPDAVSVLSVIYSRLAVTTTGGSVRAELRDETTVYARLALDFLYDETQD